MIRRTVGPGIAVDLRLRDGSGSVLCDPNELESALLNLCINARDAMPDGGRLTIATEDLRLSAADIPEDRAAPGLYVAFSVTDTGTGMPPEVLDRVFEPFFTTKSFGEGTGLGLSQVFGFAKQLGGAVTVESRLGEGAAFTIYLRASRSAPTVEIEHANGVHARGRVLVVEDDVLVAELAAGMLGELGFEATVSHSAKEALERLAEGDRPKLVFSDIVMPGGISGIELAEKVRKRFPELPVLLTTGYSEEVGGSHGFPVLQKPYELESLAGALAKILKRELTAG
jgi:CheY-like chemotaxis protein